MTISKDLFLAILSMDSYNRGYNAGIADGDENDPDGLGLAGSRIGAATFQNDSSIFVDENGEPIHEQSGFYALAYDVGANGPEGLAGTTVISYRGTDNPVGDLSSNFSNSDLWTGWRFGAGSTFGTQLSLAREFYEAVTNQNPYLVAGAVHPPENVVLTGHSLGGGLAGHIASLTYDEAFLGDHEPFAAATLIEWVKEVQQFGTYSHSIWR